MSTTLSSKGQIALPKSVRRQLGLLPGTKFACRVRGGKIVLVPETAPIAKAKVGRNAISGLPVLMPPKGTSKLTSARVRELLVDFP